jgi:hypothetical protein
MVSGTEVNGLRYTIKTTRNKSDGESRQTVVFLGKTTRSSYYYKSRKCRRVKKFKSAAFRNAAACTMRLEKVVL